MYQKLKIYIAELESDFDSIPAERKEKLEKVAIYIRSKRNAGETAKLNFICTHNSRRSHMAQIWTTVASHHLGIENLETYSGGTEATAFNSRAVAALERAGFHIKNSGGENPRYKVRLADDAEPMVCFSKEFGHEVNPQKSFAAIMTCSDADENCPFVPGAEFRQAITYRDPKESDGTVREKEVYDERCRQIAAEMFYMIKMAKQQEK